MKRYLLLALSVTALVPVARAQDNPVLPDLAPREIEITGELAISFPSLRRQPLVGFNPPPRVSEVSSERRPFAEEYLQRRAELPATPLRSPVGPAVSPYATGPRFDGSIEAGFGLYAERYLELDVASDARSGTSWRVEADYSGRSGYVAATAIDGRTAAYDLGRIAARIESPFASWRLGASVDGSLQRYALYAAEPRAAVPANPAPDRDGRSGSVAAWGERHGTDWRMRVRGTLSGTRTATDVFDPSVRIDPRTQRADAAATMEFGLETGATERGLSLAGTVEAVSVDGAALTSPAAHGWQVGAGGRFPIGSGVRVTAGISVLGMDASRAATGSGDRSIAWIAPDFRVETNRAGVRWSLENRPTVLPARLDGIYLTNPFAVDDPWTEAELRPINAALHADWSLGRLEFAAAARWIHSPNRRYFLQTTDHFSGYLGGVSEVRHGRAREMETDVDGGIYLGAGVRFRIGGSLRSARLTGLDVDVPYVAPWTIRTLLSAGFDGRKGLVQFVGRIEGPREVDLSGIGGLDPYADLDIETSYRIARSATAVFRLFNLLGNRPEWDGYLRPAPVVTAGLRWQF